MVEDILNGNEASIISKQKKNSFYYGVSDTFKFLSGVMLAASMATLGVALKGATSSLAAAGAAIAGSEVGLAFLAAAVVMTAIAVGSQYIASRNYQSANFNALEVNAKHTAKYLVKEIEGHNMCLTEPKRTDGKTWQQAMADRAAQQQIQL